MTTTLLIPTLNEVEGIQAIMPRIQKEWVNQILFVDGGSTDGTLSLIQKSGWEVIVQKRKGIRHAYIEALEHIRGDTVITFSPDGNSVPELIPKLIEKYKEGYDMVIASRYAPGAKSEDDDVLTGFGNWFFTTSINTLYQSHYTDAMVMYRIYRTNLLRELALDKDETYATEEALFRTTVGCEPLISIRAAKRKLKCADIPGDEPPRIGGKRKLQIVQWGLAYLFEVIREKFVWR
ncbi:MAG: glycosyltransferase family 2 protein [Deltaproteobacteria bacterium]|nr:glycosyltransferase family 2 protein [Deltaproteobacteria bacterium]